MDLDEISASLEEKGIGNIVVAKEEKKDNFSRYWFYTGLLLKSLSEKKEYLPIKEKIESFNENELDRLDKQIYEFQDVYKDNFRYFGLFEGKTRELRFSPYEELSWCLYLYVIKFKKRDDFISLIIKKRYIKIFTNYFVSYLESDDVTEKEFIDMCDASYLVLESMRKFLSLVYFYFKKY